MSGRPPDVTPAAGDFIPRIVLGAAECPKMGTAPLPPEDSGPGVGAELPAFEAVARGTALAGGTKAVARAERPPPDRPDVVPKPWTGAVRDRSIATTVLATVTSRLKADAL